MSTALLKRSLQDPLILCGAKAGYGATSSLDLSLHSASEASLLCAESAPQPETGIVLEEREAEVPIEVKAQSQDPTRAFAVSSGSAVATVSPS